MFPYKDPWTTFLKHLLLDLSFETWLQTLEMFLFSQAVLDLLVANLESEPGVAAERPTAMLFKRWVEGMWVVTMATYESNVPSLGCVAVKKGIFALESIEFPSRLIVPFHLVPSCRQWWRLGDASSGAPRPISRRAGGRKGRGSAREEGGSSISEHLGLEKKHEPPFNIQNIIVD